jgi:RNA polymerase sigma-70 factor (ECF subfamily)
MAALADPSIGPGRSIATGRLFPLRSPSMSHWGEDRALLVRFRRGDPAVLERVYREYVDLVERLASNGFHIINTDARAPGIARDDVADAVQETFARAFAERARLAYDGLRDYGPFLATIARNLLIDRARKRGREVSIEDLGDDWHNEPAAEGEPYADATTMKLVREYVGSLSPELRGLHNERYVRGVSQKEAARSLGLSRQQVRTLEKKLRDGLAERLEQAGIHLDEAAEQPASAAMRIEEKKAT